jgi:hypothetical protein
MNKFVMIVPLLLIVGCASKPQVVEVEVPPKSKVADAPQVVVQQPAWAVGPSNNPNIVSGFKDVEYMQRNEVIQATKDCVDNRMKPVVQYVPQKTSHGTLMLPAMVNCEFIPGYTIQDEKKSPQGSQAGVGIDTTTMYADAPVRKGKIPPNVNLAPDDYWVLDTRGIPRPASTMYLPGRN